ncbi:MAG: hypothetical protein ABI771_13110 [Betaproteobacteria bacterium]
MPQQINLYNPAFEPQRSLTTFKGAIAGWAVVAVLVAAVAAYVLYDKHGTEQRERDLAQQLTVAQTAAQTLGASVAARKGDTRLAEEIGRLETEVLGRQEVLQVLSSGKLGDTRGFSDHLRAFARQSFEGVWLTRLSIATAGRDVSIEGRAQQAAYVPGYLKRLNGETAMQGHPFSELVIQQPEPDPAVKTAVRPDYVEFRLTTKTDNAALPGKVQQ